MLFKLPVLYVQLDGKMVSFGKLESKPIGDIPHGASVVASWLAKVSIGGIGWPFYIFSQDEG